jgi:hypothetical protein
MIKKYEKQRIKTKKKIEKDLRFKNSIFEFSFYIRHINKILKYSLS